MVSTDTGRSLAVMQPYVFPYLGYIQLVGAVDTFVVYDDVTFIKGGRINRNDLLAGGRRQRFTIPVRGGSSNRHIREVLVSTDPHWKPKLTTTLHQAYGRAPYFAEIAPLIDRVLADAEGSSISDLAVKALREVAEGLEIRTRIIPSSAVYRNRDLGRVERLIDICRREGASVLINPEGGTALYERESFSSEGIELRFLAMRDVAYPQFGRHPFVPRLSIIDVLMFNGFEGTRALLDAYDLDSGLIEF